MKIDMKEALRKMFYTGEEKSDYILHVDSNGNLYYEKVTATNLEDILKTYPDYQIGEVRTLFWQYENLVDGNLDWSCHYALYLATTSLERFKSILSGNKVPLPEAGSEDVYFMMMNSEYELVDASQGYVTSSERAQPLFCLNGTELSDFESKCKDSMLETYKIFDDNFEHLLDALKDIYN